MFWEKNLVFLIVTISSFIEFWKITQRNETQRNFKKKTVSSSITSRETKLVSKNTFYLILFSTFLKISYRKAKENNKLKPRVLQTHTHKRTLLPYTCAIGHWFDSFSLFSTTTKKRFIWYVLLYRCLRNGQNLVV